MRLLSFSMVALLAACGGEDVPSCQQAVSHFYDSGCFFFDPQTGAMFSEGAVLENCKQLLATAPDSCVDELDDFRVCLANVPANASQAECDCSSEQDALLTCD